jgi:hypothetical protein
MKKNNKLSRRMFLKGASGFTLAIPLLPSLLPRESWGQTQSTVKRYFSIVGGYDYGHHQNWLPTLNQLPNVYSPSNGDQQIRYQALNSFLANQNSILSPILGNGLNPFVNKMNIFRGLNLHTRIAHGSGHMLGNIRATDGHDNLVTSLKALPTIDQVLATNRNFTPHSNDPLSIGQAYSYLKDASGNVSRTPSRWTKPNQLFSSLFTPGGNPIPEGGGGGGQSTHPRRDALSRVLEDYNRIRRGRSISTVDAQVLDNTMDRYSDILARLGGTVTASGCRYTNINVALSNTDGIANAYYYNPESHKYAFEMYARIYAAAASCDLHRVFNFHQTIPDYFDRNSTEDFHQGHSHQPWASIASNGNKVNHVYMGEIWRLYIDSFLVPLVQSLDSFTESNGRTILDNSLVHMTLESSTVHSDYNKPCLLIGSAGGAITTGHYVDYSRREVGAHREQGDNFSEDPTSPMFGHIYYGAHYNRSLTTILQALGLTPAEYEDPTINTFFQGRTDSLLGALNNGVARVGGYGHIGSQSSGQWFSNAQLYSEQYSKYNYHFYKNSLPLPPSSAT